MKITLISPYSSLASLGLRTISANLKKAGHNVKVLFLTASHQPLVDYSESLLDQVVQLSSDADLVGISLMSSYFYQAVRLTQSMKGRVKAPIIWGGIQPTSKPEECLKYADIVCVGEGEEAVLELVDRLAAGKDYSDVRNLCVKTAAGIRKNELRPLIQDLDSQPPMDYDLSGHYVYTLEDKIVPLTREILRERLIREETLIPDSGAYQTIWMRGCPYKCTYCCNNIYHTLYKGQKILRKRKVQSMIAEIKQIRQRFDFISNVWFHDDSFFALSAEDLKEFSELYKKEIGLPFCALGDPLLTTEEKLRTLVDAGLHTLQVGIQSGSENTISLYNRLHFKPESTIRLGEIINKFTPKIRVRYDIIVDNPYETDEDLLKTIRMLIRIPYPYRIQLFSLTFFPETELYRKAKADGLVKDESVDIYKKQYFKIKPTYLNFVLKLISINFSKAVVTFMVNPVVLSIFNRRWFGFGLFLSAKGAKLPFFVLRKVMGK